jgi:hypothetical protein
LCGVVGHQLSDHLFRRELRPQPIALRLAGDYDDALDVIQHDITIPSDPARVTLQFWYLIDTEETDNTSPHDTMTVTITDLQGNTLGRWPRSPT